MSSWELLLNKNTQEYKNTCELIDKIYIDLNNQVDGFKLPQSIFTGYLGLALFYFFYYKTFKREDSFHRGKVMVEKAINQLSLVNDYSFVSGLSGFMWMIFFLKENYFLNVNNLDDMYFNILYDASLQDLQNKNYDYLYGSLGVLLLVFFDQDKSRVDKYLTKIVETFKTLNCFDSEGWQFSQKNEIDLGLAHGISSVISILSMVYKKFSHETEIKRLINLIVRRLSNNKLSNQISIYPNKVSEKNTSNNSYSRLAWCYGDLGIAVSLWNAGLNTNNSKLKNESIQIMLHSCSRKNLNENLVFDASFCHGASGVFMIFHKFYQDTKILEFKIASEFWHRKILEFSVFDDGVGGFKKYNPNINAWETSLDLIEGGAGVGLTLLSSVSNVYPSWNKCFLLS